MTAPLLTLDDVAARFQMKPDVKWLKRAITERKIPYVRIKREWRLTEDQFAQLREALTCSGCEGSALAVRTTAEARFASARKSAKSASTLQAAVTERLQKPTPTSSKAKSATKSSTAPLRLVRGT